MNKPEQYIRPMSATWWLRKRSYTLFMLREATAVFVAGYSVFLIGLVWRATQGRQPFQEFMEGLYSPASMVLHLLALAMAIYHTVTWFQLLPRVIPLRRGEEKVSPGLIVGANLVAWLAISGVVAWLAIHFTADWR